MAAVHGTVCMYSYFASPYICVYEVKHAQLSLGLPVTLLPWDTGHQFQHGISGLLDKS